MNEPLRDSEHRGHVAIRDWPVRERPREKLLQSGPQHLTDAELLAILLRTGRGRISALELARAMLIEHEGLDGIAQKGAFELTRMKGIGRAKAVQVLAAFELGRRLQAGSGKERAVLRTPEDVARMMIPRTRDLLHEVFHVLALDSRNSLRREVELTRGTLDTSLVHPREVFKFAIDSNAASVIVVHNHPSGNPEPSADDIALTRQLAEAGKIVGIPLHDHLIVGGNGYTSLAERGML